MPTIAFNNAELSASTTGRLDRSTALAVGLGLHIAWTCTTLYSAQTVFGTSFGFLGLHGGDVSLLYLASVVAFGAAALTAAAVDQKVIRYSRSRLAMAIFAAVTCAGTLIAVASPAVPQLSLALECLSGVLTGIGSAMLMLYWGTALSREKQTVIAACAAIGVTFGFALNTLLLQSIPAPFGGLCAALLPIIEFLILRDITPLPLEKGGPFVPFNPLPANKARFSMRFVAPMALVGSALGILKHLSVQMTLGGSTAEGVVILLMASGMTILLFVLYCLVPRLRETDSFLRVAVPALACAALALSLMSANNAALHGLFILVAYIIVESLTWISLASIAHNARLSPVFLFGISRGIITLAMLAGGAITLSLVPNTITPALAGTPEAILPILAVLLSAGLIALGYALMPRSRDVLSLVSSCPLVRVVSLELDEGVSVLPTIKPTDGDMGEENTEETANDMPDAPSGEAEETATQEAETAQAAASASAPKSEARLAMETRAQASGAAATEEKRVGKFSRKVKLIAQTYLLTERETDILFELAKGNSPAYIQEKYYISAGTVKTHVRNIYRKLDVHKRQELLALVEEFDAYDK